MPITADLFRSVASLVVSAKARSTAAHQDFLTFYREIVETLPTESVKAFGTMSVAIVGKSGWGIELTATDYIFWQEQIGRGVRFEADPALVKLDMLNRLSGQAEAARLLPEERKALIALLETGVRS